MLLIVKEEEEVEEEREEAYPGNIILSAIDIEISERTIALRMGKIKKYFLNDFFSFKNRILIQDYLSIQQAALCSSYYN